MIDSFNGTIPLRETYQPGLLGGSPKEPHCLKTCDLLRWKIMKQKLEFVIVQVPPVIGMRWDKKFAFLLWDPKPLLPMPNWFRHFPWNLLPFSE